MDAFNKLDVWKRSRRLSVDVYRICACCRDRGFRDQVTRTAVSVASNIAQGYERGSRPDYVRFLRFAKGSCGELRTQLYIGAEAKLLDRSHASQLADEASSIDAHAPANDQQVAEDRLAPDVRSPPVNCALLPAFWGIV